MSAQEPSNSPLSPSARGDNHIMALRLSRDIPSHSPSPTLFYTEAEFASEERRNLLRKASIDTTCSSADPHRRTSSTLPPAETMESLRRSQSSASFGEGEEPSEAEWTSTIVGSFDLCGSVRYILQVRLPPRKWLIRRRYTDFVSLHDALKKRFGNAGLPGIPPKSWSLFGPSLEFLEAREKALQRYIDTIAASRAPLRNCPAVRRFLAAPRPEDRHTFLSSGVPPLPTDLPDLPADEEWPADIKADDKAAVSALVHEGAAALRKLYVFEQTLETDLDCVRQSMCFDRERIHVEEALATLSEFSPRLAAMCTGPDAAPELRAWKDIAVFVNECARVAGQALSWGSAYDSEEALVIKKVLGNSDVPVKSIRFYELRAQNVAQECAASKDVCWSAAPPHSVVELQEQIVNEMELRSKASQCASVARLRRLSESLKDGLTLATCDKARQLPPFHLIVDAITKRVGVAEGTVEALMSQDVPGVSMDLTGMAYNIADLQMDIMCALEAIAEAAATQPEENIAELRERLTALEGRVNALRNSVVAPSSVALDALHA